VKKILPLLLVAALISVSPAIATAQEEDDFRLMLERIRLFTETNVEEAFTLIDTAKARRPNDPNLMAAEAQADLRVGNVRSAEILLERAHSLAPRNEDIAQQLREVRLLRAPFISVDTSYRSTSKTAREKFVRLHGEMEVNQDVSVGLKLENDHVTATENLTFSNGQTKRYNESVQRGEGYAIFNRPNGDWLKTSFFVATQVFGAGAEYNMVDTKGTTTFEANVHRPNWEDYTISTIDGGKKDNIRVSRIHNFSAQWIATGGVGINHYGLDSHDDLSTSVAFDAGVGRNFDASPYLGQDSSFSLNYNLDAEYAFYNTTLHNTTNANYQPLLVGHRMLHSFTMHAGKDFGQIGVYGYGGYAADVYGGHGPLGGGLISYNPIDALSIELRAARGVEPTASQETVDEIGLNVKWKFL
jgi:hypothetical protein